MDRSYLVEVLRALDSEETNDFELFIASAYYTRNAQQQQAQALFQVLQENLRSEKPGNLEKETIYPQVFGEETWIEGRLEKLMAELNVLLRQFLLHRYYFRAENEFNQQLDLARILYNKGLQKRQNQTLNKIKSSQERLPWKDTDFFFQQFRLEYLKYELESNYNQKKSDLNIPAVLLNLSLYYQLQRINLLNHYWLQRKMTTVNLPNDAQLLANESQIPTHLLEYSPSLLISIKINHLLTESNPTLEDFNNLYYLLHEHESEIEKGTLEQYFAYLRSLCVMFINQGQEVLLPVFHRLVKDNLERGFLYPVGEGDQLPPSTLLNLVSLAIRVGELDWLKTLLDTHQDRIIGDNETRDFYCLNQALYLFALKQYDEALDYIPASSTYLDYHLMARKLEIKIYYETQSDLLQYKLDAFKMFISRASKKVLSDGLRKRNADFANFVYQIIQSTPGDKTRAKRLLQRIQEKKWAADRDWLLEKVKELG